jgi:phage shock protein C
MARRLYRSSTDRKIAGVCGGIAEHFDIDPVFVRLMAIIPLFIGVPTPLIYLICWAVLPKGPAPGAAEPGVIDVTPAKHPAGDGALIAGLVILFTGLILLGLNLGLFDWEIFRWWRWRLVWPLSLIAIGLLVLARSIGASRADRGTGAR